MDIGLDYGLDYGLDFGLNLVLDSYSVLVLLFLKQPMKASLPNE